MILKNHEDLTIYHKASIEMIRSTWLLSEIIAYNFESTVLI